MIDKIDRVRLTKGGGFHNTSCEGIYFTDEEVYGKPAVDRPLSIEEFFLADCKTDEELAEIVSDIEKLKTGELEL